MTHILQPLDVAVFQPYKAYHDKAIKKALRQGEFEYGLADFFYDLKDIRVKALLESTIRSAFRESGLWPILEEKTLSKLKVHETRDPPAYLYDGPSQDSFPVDPSIEIETTLPRQIPFKVPQHFAEAIQCIDAMGKDIKNRYNRSLLSSPITQRVLAIAEGVIPILHGASLTSRTHSELVVGIAEQAKRKINRSSRRLPGIDGPQYVYLAWAKIKLKRKEREEAKEMGRSWHYKVAANKIKKTMILLTTKKSEVARLEGGGVSDAFYRFLG
jgi:hypothetical protein